MKKYISDTKPGVGKKAPKVEEKRKIKRLLSNFKILNMRKILHQKGIGEKLNQHYDFLNFFGYEIFHTESN